VGRGRRGCLVGNTTAELVPGDDAARALAAAVYDGLTEVVTTALARARATGEVTTSASPEAQRDSPIWSWLAGFWGWPRRAPARPYGQPSGGPIGRQAPYLILLVGA
jgi:hypothetical protein